MILSSTQSLHLCSFLSPGSGLKEWVCSALPASSKCIHNACTWLPTSRLPVYIHSQQEKKNSLNTSPQLLHWKTCWNCKRQKLWLLTDSGDWARYTVLQLLYFSQAYNYHTEFCQTLNIHLEKQLSAKDHWNARMVWSEAGLLAPRTLPVQSSALEYVPSGLVSAAHEPR